MNSLNKPSWRLSSYQTITIVFLVVVHIVGVCGLNSPSYHSLFEKTVSFNLLISFYLVLSAHPSRDKRLLLFCLLAFMTGMIAEIIGVSTGYPFGNYYYTPVFGLQICAVPVIIGINWILLIYVTGIVCNSYIHILWARIAIGAILMAFIDVLLEKFAIRHHLWVWQESLPPVQNYISWFLISVILQWSFTWLLGRARNPIAYYYLLILISFLVVDHVCVVLSKHFGYSIV